MKSFHEVVKIISEEKSLKEDEVLTMIEKKREEFGDLISEVGAAYIVAKELGVDLSEEVNDELKIKDLLPGITSKRLKVKIVKIYDENVFTRKDGTQGRVKNILVGDETGISRLSLWDEQIDDFNFNENDSIEIFGLYTKKGYNDLIELRLGRYGYIKKIDEEIVVKDKSGEEFSIREYESKNIIDINEEGKYVEVKGYITTFFRKNIVMYFCPECKARIENNICKVHGEVEPEIMLLLSGIIDDGSSSIIFNIFREDVEKFIGLSQEELIKTIEEKGEGYIYDEVLSKKRGKMFYIKGAVKRNTYNNSLEINVHRIRELNILNELSKEVKEYEQRS